MESILQDEIQSKISVPFLTKNKNASGRKYNSCSESGNEKLLFKFDKSGPN